MENIFKKAIGFIAVFAAILVIGTGGKASAASLELTQQQKEDYYKQYVELAAEVDATYPGANITVNSMDEFKEEDWKSPEEFKQYLITRATLTITFNDNDNGGIAPRSVATKTKKASLNGVARDISVTGSFNTQLNSSSGAQQFAGIRSITSKLASGSGTWSQTGYDYSLIDGGRTYSMDIGGKLNLAGVTTSHRAHVEFHCNSNGSIS